MVEPKQKPAGKPVHTADKARLPRTAMHAVWLRTREGTRRLVAEEHRDGQYQEAAARRNVPWMRLLPQQKRLSVPRCAAGKSWRSRSPESTRRTVQPSRLRDAASGSGAAAAGAGASSFDQIPPHKNQTPNPGQRTKTAAARRAEPIQPNLPDIHQSRLRRDSLYRFKVTTRRKPQPRQTPAPKTAVTAASKIADTNKARKTAANAVRRAKQAAQATREATQKLADAVMAGLKALWASTQTLVAAIAAGGTAAVFVVVIICMIALVLGSAFGIFFAGESTGTGITVQEAITQLNGEYQNRLKEIENSVTHDRQEIVSNDGSYAIAWQDVLAVFAARTSGAEDGASVAFIDEDNLDRLRQILWDMNEVDYHTDTNASEVEIADDKGNTTTTNVTETVLTIELTHKTAEEMRTEYAFNARQNEYLTLLSSEDTAELWNQLLGGFVAGSGEVLPPAGDWQPTGALQWPLTIPGTITSPFGYRTDPITGEASYHSGTDIAAPEGSPILAAAGGTVTIANALDSWGGGYGYYVRIDHGNGLETLYAHCSAICVSRRPAGAGRAGDRLCGPDRAEPPAIICTLRCTRMGREGMQWHILQHRKVDNYSETDG